MTPSEPGTKPATFASGERAVLALRRYLRYPADDSGVGVAAGAGVAVLAPSSTDDWLPLPDWADFAIGLGAAIVLRPEGSPQLACAVATPNRAYIAAFCAVGAVLARIGTPPPVDLEAHYRFLSRLPKQTTLVYWPTPVFKKTGLLVGCVHKENKDWVQILFRARRHSASTRIPKEECWKIQVADQQLSRLPSHSTMRKVTVRAGLAAAVLSPSELGNFLSDSRLECALVGTENRLREEIRGATFAVPSTFRGAALRQAVGSLQDILRVPEFGVEGQCSWAAVYPFLLEKNRSQPPRTPPRLVVFDGSSAFLRCRADWPNCSWIAVLDRTDPRFFDASSEINRLYTGSTQGRMVPLPQPHVPSDIDCVLFPERQ